MDIVFSKFACYFLSFFLHFFLFSFFCSTTIIFKVEKTSSHVPAKNTGGHLKLAFIFFIFISIAAYVVDIYVAELPTPSAVINRNGSIPGLVRRFWKSVCVCNVNKHLIWRSWIMIFFFFLFASVISNYVYTAWRSITGKCRMASQITRVYLTAIQRELEK